MAEAQDGRSAGHSHPAEGTEHEDSLSFRAKVWRFGFVWLALMVLLFSSLGTAYLKLGLGNLVVGIAIAVLKTALVVWLFMELKAATGMVRIVGLTGLFMLSVLFSLSGVDYRTRLDQPAAVQKPAQVEPLVQGDAAAHMAPR